MENTHLIVNDNTLNKILDGVKSVFVLNELEDSKVLSDTNYDLVNDIDLQPIVPVFKYVVKHHFNFYPRLELIKNNFNYNKMRFRIIN